MKKRLIPMTFFMMGVLAFIPLKAQADLDIKTIVQGVVKATKASSIEILNTQNGSKVHLAINSNTVYDNVQKLTDLKVGDKVQIEYQKDQNMATIVTKMDLGGMEHF